MKNILLFLFLAIGFSTAAQTQLDQYQYVIVPTQFDTFNKENQYQTSTLVKFLLEKKGIPAVYENKLPDALKRDRCLSLRTVLNDNSNLFATRVTISFVDCDENEIFITEEGKSKLKDYKPAFAEAIRKSFISFEGYTYTFSGTEVVNEPPAETIKKDVITVASSSNITVTEEKQKVVAAPVASTPIPAPTVSESVEKMVTNEVVDTENVLYAQAITNGYQLVDSTPKIVLKILRTSFADHYIATGEDKNGMVYKKDGAWIFEFYEGDNRVSQKLAIKF